MISPPQRQLSGRWLVIVFLLLSAGIGALWYSALSAYESAVLRERGRELQAIAELKIAFVRFWLDERRSDAAVQADRPLMARTLVPGRIGTYDPQQLLAQFEVVRKAYDYEAILLLDRHGNAHLQVGAPSDRAPARTLQTARGAMDAHKTIISSAYRASSGDGRSHIDIDIASPVFDREQPDAPVVGALVFHLDPRDHLDPFLRHWPAPSGSGETFLFERSGEEIVYLSSLRHADAATLRRRVDDPELPAALAARGGQGLVEGLDYRGVPVLAAVGQVPDMPWFVVAKLDRAEVLAPVRREALWSGTLAALLALSIGLAMLAWHRRGRSELALAQQAAAQAALAASEARWRKLIDSARDLLVLFDRGMRIMYSSPSVAHQLGRSLIGESIGSGTALVHPEDVGRVEAARRDALARPGLPQHFEHRLKGRYDHWMTVEASFTSFFDDPDIAALAYVGRDVSERRWAEQALRESEERYRFLFKLSPDAVFVHWNNAILYTNDAAVRLFRAESERDLVGRDWHELVMQEDWPKTEQRIAYLTSNGEAFLQPAEMRYLALDGEIIEVEAAGARIVVDGKPAIMSVVRNISERKRAEAELKRSEARYRFLFESNPLPMWVFDVGTLSFLEVNGTAVTQYGYSREEFLSMTLREIRPPEEVGEVEKFIKADRREQGRIWIHRRKDGSLLKVAIWFQDVDYLGRPARMVLAENVTARVEVEQALAESEARLRAIFDSAPVGIAIADASGRYLMVNREQCRMLGYEEAELLQRTFADITHPEDVQANLDINARMRAGEIEIGSMEKRYVRKDGSVFWVLLTIGLVRAADGTVIGSVGVAKDITELREAEARRLAYARQQRDTLVREVHHRIKNHLQGLAGLLRQHMQEHPALAPVLRNFAAQINAISIVHGLQGRAERGDASLRSLAAEIAGFLGNIMGTRIGVDCPEEICRWAVAEEEAVPLALILNELLTNALRHGADTTQVRLALECHAGGARLTLDHPGRLAAGVDFAAGKGLGTGLSLIRSLLPPAGAALSLTNAGADRVEARLDLAPPLLQPMAQAQVVSLR